MIDWKKHTSNLLADVAKYGAPIWDNLYMVRMRQRDTYSTSQLSRFGLPTVGHAGYDREMHNSPSTVMLSINDIVENFRVGIPMHFVDNANVEEMYTIVNAYLAAWEKMLRQGVNMRSAPLEDLMLLDRMCVELFTQSRIFNGPREQHIGKTISELFGDLDGSGNLGLVDMRSLIRETPNESASAKPPEPERHQSYAESFSHYAFSGQNPAARNAPPEKKTSSRWK